MEWLPPQTIEKSKTISDTKSKVPLFKLKWMNKRAAMKDILTTYLTKILCAYKYERYVSTTLWEDIYSETAYVL